VVIGLALVLLRLTLLHSTATPFRCIALHSTASSTEIPEEREGRTDEASRQFCEADIDQLLATNTTTKLLNAKGDQVVAFLKTNANTKSCSNSLGNCD
jgi:hypothetical protein